MACRDFLGKAISCDQYVIYSDEDTTRLTLGKVVNVDLSRKRSVRIRPLVANGFTVGDDARTGAWKDQFKTGERVCIVDAATAEQMVVHSKLIA